MRHMIDASSTTLYMECFELLMERVTEMQSTLNFEDEILILGPPGGNSVLLKISKEGIPFIAQIIPEPFIDEMVKN